MTKDQILEIIFWRKNDYMYFNFNAYLCARPCDQAKIEAILLVLVSPPFWWTRKWRVTVPWAASASIVFPSGQTCTKFLLLQHACQICNRRKDRNIIKGYVWGEKQNSAKGYKSNTSIDVINPREPNPVK